MRAVQDASGRSSRQKKHGGAAESQKQAIAYGCQDGMPDGGLVAACVSVRHNRQEQHGDGIGDGGRKQYEGQAHARQYAVYAKSVGVAQPVCHKTVWNIDRLNALQQVQNQTVGGQRHGKTEQLSHDAAVYG